MFTQQASFLYISALFLSALYLPAPASLLLPALIYVLISKLDEPSAISTAIQPDYFITVF